MINSPWQADDDADNQSGDNRGDSPASHHPFWPFRPLLWILQSGCQPYARTDHNQRPAVKPRILLQWSIAWRISPRSIIGKAPRSLICCNATASWLFRREVFRPSCLRVASCTNGKEAGSVSRLLIWVLGLAWQVCEGDWVISVASSPPTM